MKSVVANVSGVDADFFFLSDEPFMSAVWLKKYPQRRWKALWIIYREYHILFLMNDFPFAVWCQEKGSGALVLSSR